MLAVGDSTKLEIIFHTKRYKGRITKRPKIQTNEGPPDKHVQIVSQVTDRPDSTYPVVIQPYKLDLSQFGEKMVKEKKFIINNVSDQDVKIEVICSADDYFKVELPGKIKAGKGGKAKLKLKKESIDDSFEKSFTFEATTVEDGKVTRFTVPVKRTINVPGTEPKAKTPPEKKGH